MDKLASGYGLIEGPVWDLRRGLIFTGAEGADSPDAGSIFRLHVAVAGLPVPPALVKLP